MNSKICISIKSLMGCEPEPTIPRPSLLSCFCSCLHLEAWAILSGAKHYENTMKKTDFLKVHNELEKVTKFNKGVNYDRVNYLYKGLIIENIFWLIAYNDFSRFVIGLCPNLIPC